ncbi:MAG TPA: hypothetical protein VKS79_16060 [Gemmataceae bacterium]|nr:hypothetical protein [Gemmataceae bacterium]
MALSTHDPGCDKAGSQTGEPKATAQPGQSAAAISPPKDDSGAFLYQKDPTKLVDAFQPTKTPGAGRNVRRRPTGWWIVDDCDVEIAGPFQALADVEAYLDWESNQRPNCEE